ncbi:MAG TPA: hydrogenase [Pseudonocardiaceae bacterium]
MRPPAPGVFDGSANTVAVLVLLIEFAMLRATLLRSQVRLYAAQSFVMSVLAGIIAAVQHVPELYVLAVLSFALKVIIVPWVVLRLVHQAHAEIAGSSRLRVASAVLLAIVVAAFGFFAVGALHIQSTALPSTALAISVAIVLVAFLLMVLRNDVVSQAVGFFSLENGVSLASLVVAAGLPLILEVAFLFDLLVAVVVFGVLMRVHHDQRASLSTSDLTELRG